MMVSKNELDAKFPIVFRIISTNIAQIPIFTTLLNFPLNIYPDFTKITKRKRICTVMEIVSKMNKSVELFSRPPQTK